MGSTEPTGRHVSAAPIRPLARNTGIFRTDTLVQNTDHRILSQYIAVREILLPIRETLEGSLSANTNFNGWIRSISPQNFGLDATFV